MFIPNLYPSSELHHNVHIVLDFRAEGSYLATSVLTAHNDNDIVIYDYKSSSVSSLLLLVLSVSDHIAEILVVKITSNVQREHLKHLIYLQEE